MIEAGQDVLDAENEGARKAEARSAVLNGRGRRRGIAAEYLDDEFRGLAAENRRPEHGRCLVLRQRESAGVSWTEGTFLNGSTGQSVDGSPSSVNFLSWWDGDLSRELLNGNGISQFDGEGEGLTAQGCSANNGTKSTPSLSGDIIGDWREEVIFRCGNSIRVYTTNQLTQSRIYTLMHDPQYRVAIAWQNVEYNQPPHPSFHIGAGMKAPPIPDIHVR